MIIDQKKIDWKFWLSTCVGVLGLLIAIGVPYLLWKVDLQSKSIALRIISSTPLQIAKSPIDGLKLMLDGNAIDDAYLSTLEIQNDGSKPVLAADFESPIQITSSNKIVILRAQIAERKPESLPAQLEIKADSVFLRPLLMNPGDSTVITIVSSGGAAKWTPLARIAGVNEIKVEQRTTREPPRVAFTWAIALISIAFYSVLLITYAYPTPKFSGKNYLLFTALAFVLISGISMNLLAIEYSVKIQIPEWAVVPFVIVSSMLLILVLMRLSRMAQRLADRREKILGRPH